MKAGKSKEPAPAYIQRAVEDSLTRLKTDVIDLYQLHAPDKDTPLKETLTALDSLVKSGKVRYVGCSNLPAWEVTESHYISRDRGLAEFVSCRTNTAFS